MVTWNQFVKDIRDKRKVSHKEAMKIASPLWAAQKGPKKKKKKNAKKKIEAPPEISEFPKPKKKTKGTRQTVAKTTTQNVTDLGGSLTDTFVRRKRTKWGDFKKRNSILLDSAHKFTSRKSKVSRV